MSIIKKWAMNGLMLSVLSLMVCIPYARQSYALPFVKVGPAVGIGVGVASELEDIDREVSHTAFGVSALLDIPIVKAEIDLLYMKTNTVTTNFVPMKSKSEQTSDFVSIPVILRYNISPIPLLDLAFGGGYERRFLVGDGSDADLELNYIPLSVRADIKVPMLASLGIEGRFSYQLGDSDVHDMMVFAHIAF